MVLGVDTMEADGVEVDYNKMCKEEGRVQLPLTLETHKERIPTVTCSHEVPQQIHTPAGVSLMVS